MGRLPHKTPTLYSPEYALLLKLLREKRKAAGLTQEHIAARLGYQTSAVSKMERGELRMDVVQLRLYSLACGISIQELLAEWEQRIKATG